MSVIMMLTMVPSIAFAAVGPYSVRAYAVDAGGKIDTSDGSYVELNDMLTDGKDRPTSDEMLAALKGAGAVADSVTAEQLNFEFYNGDDGNIKKINKGTATVYGFTKEALKLGYIACTYSVDEAEPVEQSVNFNVYVDARGANKGSEPIVISKTFTDGQTYNDILPTDKEILEAAGAVDGQTARYSSPWFGDTAWSNYLSASWNDAKNMEGFNLTNEAKDGGSLNINVQLTDLVTINVTYYLVASDNMADGQYIASATAGVYDGEALPDAAVLFSDKDITGDDKVYSWIKAADWAAMGTDRTLNDIKSATKADMADTESNAYVAVLEKRGSIDGAAVSFDVNGGSDISGSFDNVKVGDTITLPETTRSSWTFLGWYVNGKYVGMNGEEYTVNEAVEFTAQWEGDVTFNIWDYSVVDGNFNNSAKLTSVELTVNTVDGIPSVDEVIAQLWGNSVEIGKDDKVYGWYTTDTAKEIAEKIDKIDRYTTVSGADEITNGYANAFVVRDASAEYVTLTLEPNGGSFDGVTNNNKKINVIAGRALTAEQLEGPNNTPKNYGNLYGWFDADGNQVKAGDSIDANTTLYAKYSKDVTLYLYDINAVDNNNSQTKTVEVVLDEEIGDMTSVFENASAPLQVEANDEVYGWYTSDVWTNIYKNGADAIKAAASVKTAKADDDSIAYFAVVDKDANAERVTASYDFNGGKTSSGLSEWEPITNIVSGTKVTLPELTNDGWEFAGWQDDKGNTVHEDAVITEDTLYTAQWTRDIVFWVMTDGIDNPVFITASCVKGENLPDISAMLEEHGISVTAEDAVAGWFEQSVWDSFWANDGAYDGLFGADAPETAAVAESASYVAAINTDGQLADCTVTFDSNGGSDVEAKTVKAGKLVTEPATPTKDNRTFAGWYLVKQNGEVAKTQFDFSKPVTGDVKLIARWNRTVHYWFYKDAVIEDTGKEIVRTFPEDQALPDVTEFPNDFTVDGEYTIHGWYSSADYEYGQEVSDLNTLIPVELSNYNVYDDSAEWGCWLYCIVETDASKVTVSFDNVLYGDSIEPVKTTKGAGIAAVEPENVQEGYKFVEWVNGSDAVDLTTATFSENTTLKARWAVEVTYKVYSNNDFTIPTTETEWVNVKISSGNGAAMKAAPTYGWFTAETWEDITAGKDVTLDNATAVDSMTVTGPTEFYGMAIDNHTVMFKGGVGETVTGLPVAPVTVSHGETVTNAPEVTRTGYTFKGWSVDGEAVVDLNTYMITEDTTFTTLWDTETFEVSFISSSDAVTIDSQFVESGKTAAEPTVVLPEGYFIAGYYNNGDYTVDYDFDTAITEAKTIYVRIDIQKFDVTFDAVLDGVSNPETQTVEYGKTVTAVDALTNENNTFAGWKLKDTDDEEIIDITKYPITEATDFVAVWDRKTVNITFDVSGHSADGKDIATQIYKGTKVSVPEVNAAAGYKVDSWYDAAKNIVDLSTATFSEDTVLTPKWAVEVTYKVYSNNNFVNAEDDSEWVAIKLSGESMPVTKTATHGWYTEGDWEQIAAQGEYDYSDFETVTRVSEPITLYGMNVSGHTITFSAGTGIKATGIPSMQTVEYGQRLADEVISAVPERTDISMEFKGWTIDGINAVDLTEYIVTGDAQFTALWGKKEYTVEFNNPQAIGSFTGSTAAVIYGEKVVVPEVEVPDGYELEGWYTSEDYTEGTKFDVNTAITADYTLYARWSAEVTYNLYNSKSTLNPERVMTEFIPLGDQANLDDKTDEVTEGFLYGWFDAATWENVVANKIPNFAVNWEQYKLNYGEFEVNEPVAVYGKYAKTFNVTFSAGEVIKADNMPDAQKVLEGGYASEPAETPSKDGYVFVGWNFNFANTKITADTVIEATWVAAEYKITYDANGGYFAPNFTPEKTISYGEKYGMLPNSAQVMKSGSTLKGWTKDIEAEPIVLVKANDMYDVYGDTTLYAVWDNSKVQVTYVANGGAVTGVASGTEQVDYGTVITREAEKAGLVFEGWYYDAALTQKYNDEPVIEATTLYAKYQAQITFRVYENATRDNTLVEPKIVMVDEYDEIELPAAEELGVEMGSTDEFIGWYTETEFNKLTAGEDASVFTGNADTEMTLYANIVRHYTVTFDSVGGTEIAAQDVRYNGFATEPEAPKKEGNTFLGWYVGEAADAYDFTTPVTGNLVLTAKWNTNIYTVTFKSGVGGVDDVIDYVYHGSLFNTGNAGVPAFERLGYTQDGWLLDGVKYDETAPVKGNLTLTANWIKNEFTAVIDGTYTFTGSAITPAVIVTDKTTGDKLVSELYTVTYDVDATVGGNNAKMYFDKPLNAGAYTATVAPVAFGGYDACEAVTIKFVISQADINEASLGFYLGYDDEVDDTVAYDPDNLFKYEYTGSPIEGLVDIWTLDINGEPNEQLEVNTDYSLAYENDITSAGEKTVTVSGTGNYTGTKELKYVITKVNINISDYYATITPEYFIFNGEAQQPSVTVKPNEQADNSLVLEYGTDYTVGYIAPDGVDLVNGAPVYPGLYTVVIEGLGNYEGQVTTKPQYTIYRKGVASEDITVEIVDGPEFDYAGAPVTPEVVVKDTTRNITLVKDTDYEVEYFNNSGIGEASIKITGINNYDSERTEAFWIVGPKEISEATIAEIEDVIYDGSAQEPELTITDGDYALVKGTDYTVAYSDNVNAGQATITVTGIGKYTGTKEEFFDINARSIENAEITGVEDKYSATGLAIEPTVTVTDDLGNVLVITNDYTVAYVDNTAVGTATITVTGLGNYTGTKIITFEIVNSVFYTTGIVKYASGNPVVGGTVTLKGTTKDGTPVSRSTTTDSTGRYYFTDLKDGSYTVTYKKSKVSAILNPGSPQ